VFFLCLKIKLTIHPIIIGMLYKNMQCAPDPPGGLRGGRGVGGEYIVLCYGLAVRHSSGVER